MRKVLAFLLIAGLLLTASPAFADSPSELTKGGGKPPVTCTCPTTGTCTCSPTCTCTAKCTCTTCPRSTPCPVTTTVVTGVLSKVLHEDCHNQDCVHCFEYFVTPTGGTPKRVEFGPKWYINTKTVTNYDGLNGIQTIALELDGLIALGTSVPFKVKLCKDTSYEAFWINNLVYRNESGPPPWSGGPPKPGKGKGK